MVPVYQSTLGISTKIEKGNSWQINTRQEQTRREEGCHINDQLEQGKTHNRKTQHPIGMGTSEPTKINDNRVKIGIDQHNTKLGAQPPARGPHGQGQVEGGYQFDSR
jgi:hypothetical protein